MAKRSLQASLAGVKQAKKAFDNLGWTQDNLAAEVNLKTRQPVWRFFTNRPIERYTFIEICSVLELNWREIAENPPSEGIDSEAGQLISIEALVKQVRSQRRDKVQQQCGILHLLDTNYPVAIEDIYVEINISQEITSRQWIEITNLEYPTCKELNQTASKTIPGIEAITDQSKLRILGQPGSGKTTFLQYLAIECNRGNFASNLIPIFISLRDFADESKKTGDFSLLNYIEAELLDCGILASDTVEILIEGKILLLLDGLDEVLDHDKHIISQEIVRFSEKYSKNILIVTCRTPAKTNTLRRFSDIEITPFTQRQIIAFTHKWFAIFTKNHLSNQDIGRQFLAQLDLPENLPLRRLVATPLFLHLACWVFHRQEQFPSKKAEFYKQCLYLLLNKWDTIRGIKRDEVYQGFSLPQKLKLISMLATKTFEKGVYFFEQSAIQDYISDFICNLPNAPSDPEELEYDSEIVLKEIELQHGIIVERVQGVFSFSCLTFQEYFIARKIALYEHLQSLSVLKSLVTHISDPRWREVFILTVTMLRSADRLISLMKQEIDNLVASDAYVQEFLTWASQTYLVTLQPTLSTTSFAFTQIQAQMSSPQQEMILQSWWQNDHLSLSERLETVASVHRSIESDWNFSLEQQQILERYYNANKLLIDCLNSNCQVTFALRREIETALLLF